MFRIGIIALGLLGLSGCAAHGHAGVTSPSVTVHPSTYQRPARPGPNYYWVNAHFSGGVFISGRWVYRAPTVVRVVPRATPRPNARPHAHNNRVWVPGHYVGHGPNRRWVPGHYKPRPRPNRR